MCKIQEIFFGYYYDKQNVNVEGNFVVGTDYPNCVNFIVFMVRKLAVKCWLSSASDNIRGIWAYTVALMQVSIEKEGNHPTVLIFDEPIQHSIIPNDMGKFFESILCLGNDSQTIMGITVKDTDTQKIIEELKKGTYNLIKVKNKAFQRLDG